MANNILAKQVFLALFFISTASLLSAQSTEEVIATDTNTVILNVIYQNNTAGYYYKKIAVYANDSNNIAIEKTFNPHGQNGIFKVFYPSGQLMLLTVYANNKINGDWTWYQQDGTIKVKGQYKKGVKHGYWAYKHDKSYGKYKKGLKSGRWKHTDNNNKKHITRYQKGILKQ